MKKLVALFLVLLLVLPLAGCNMLKDLVEGKVKDAISDVMDDIESAIDDAIDVSIDGRPGGTPGSLVDWMGVGTFSYDFTVTSEYDGMSSESAGSVAYDNGNMAITTETEADGEVVTSRIIILDGEMYVIDDANKMIIHVGQVSSELTGTMAVNYEGMTLVGSGEGEVNGRTLPYDEYDIDGITTRFYMDGGQVYAIESIMEEDNAWSLMIITNASNTVPAGVFDLPEGYTEMGF